MCLQCRRPGFNPWVGKIPWRGEWLSTPIFLSGEFHGQRSLKGYSPWGHKESDMISAYTLHTVVLIIQPSCEYAENRCISEMNWVLFLKLQILLNYFNSELLVLVIFQTIVQCSGPLSSLVIPQMTDLLILWFSSSCCASEFWHW